MVSGSGDGNLVTPREDVAIRAADRFGAALREQNVPLEEWIESGRKIRAERIRGMFVSTRTTTSLPLHVHRPVDSAAKALQLVAWSSALLLIALASAAAVGLVTLWGRPEARLGPGNECQAASTNTDSAEPGMTAP